MKRLLTLLALAGLSAAAGACGDDSGDDDGDKGKTDASVKDAAAPRPQQIDTDSLGDACKSATDCKGAGQVECLEDLGGQVDIPGGYCTAACTTDAECGPQGFCPAAALSAFGGGSLGGIDLGAIIPQNCVLKCTKSNDAGGGCARSDQVCGALADALPPAFKALAAAFPAATMPFCFAPVDLSQFTDGGLPDAGALSGLLGGLDAGR
jgi:hypothetical protein